MSRSDEWLEAGEAARILSRNSGRTIPLDYVRQLAHKGKIRFKPKDGRTNVYWRADVEAYPAVRVRRQATA